MVKQLFVIHVNPGVAENCDWGCIGLDNMIHVIQNAMCVA